MPKEKQGSEKKTVHIILVSIGAMTALAIAAAVAVRFTGAGVQLEPEPTIVMSPGGGRGTVVAPEYVDRIRDEFDIPVKDGAYRTRMSVDWQFPSSDEPSTNAYVENAPTNTRTVYFDLILTETNELIYSSPFIPVGARIENFTLDARIPAGQHSGTVVYHLVDDDHQEISTVSVAVTLNILTG